MGDKEPGGQWEFKGGEMVLYSGIWRRHAINDLEMDRRRKEEKERERKKERQTDGQTDGQTDRQTDRQRKWRT